MCVCAFGFFFFRTADKINPFIILQYIYIVCIECNALQYNIATSIESAVSCALVVHVIRFLDALLFLLLIGNK